MFANLRGQWEILNDGGDFKSIDFINDEVGWIVGEGTLLKTEDGGDTWNTITLPITEDLDLIKIDFINDNIGWVIHHYPENHYKYHHDILFKTKDGGQTWFALEVPLIDTGFDFSVVNDTVIYIVGANDDSNIDYILKNVNGGEGENWIDISISQPANVVYQSVCFLNNKVGIVLGRYYDNAYPVDVRILNTIDGGNNWNVTVLADFTRYGGVSSLQFIDDSTAYFLAYKGSEHYTEYFLYASSDNGKSWSVKTQYSNAIKSAYFLNNTTGYAIMDDSLGHHIVKSIDGGLSWELKHTLNWRGYKLYFSDAKVWYILGDLIFGSAVWRSVDNGDNWMLNMFSYPFYDVYFFDKNKGYAFGGYQKCHMGCFCVGSLFFTDDGGKTWNTNRKLFGSLRVHSCYFLDDDVGFTLGTCNNFIINKTTDSGENWAQVYEDDGGSTGFAFWGNDISFINDEIGWVAGNYIAGEWDTTGGAILGTNDGGENWDLVWKYPDTDRYKYPLNSIHAVNRTAWAAGEGGLIVKYTEKDQWQAKSSATDLPLNDIFFSDENHGWITGGYLNKYNKLLILLKTIDGGDTWQEIPGFDYEINDMYFADSLHGWAVGNDTSYIRRGQGISYHGIILETVDGGNTWNVIVEGLSAPLNTIHFKDGFGWAVGRKGLVLRYNGVNWIEEKSIPAIIPHKFELSQNYPNPFNPKTIINYEIPIVNHVDVSIYNLLGQKIATLVDRRQNAGTYQVEWDGSGFASGIYYYQLRTDAGFIQTKKLILLK
jgi:photosystem II stability/assembly factor-like uncharacterized protein